MIHILSWYDSSLMHDHYYDMTNNYDYVFYSKMSCHYPNEPNTAKGEINYE